MRRHLLLFPILVAAGLFVAITHSREGIATGRVLARWKGPTHPTVLLDWRGDAPPAGEIGLIYALYERRGFGRFLVGHDCGGRSRPVAQALEDDLSALGPLLWHIGEPTHTARYLADPPPIYGIPPRFPPPRGVSATGLGVGIEAAGVLATGGALAWTTRRR